MRFPYRGAGLVIVCGSKVLLGTRSKSPFKGSWCIPGGSAEKGETDLETALRETLEETGLDVGKLCPGGPLSSWKLRLPFFSWTSFIYEIDAEKQTVASEFSYLGWERPCNLKKKPFRPFLHLELKKAGKVCGRVL